MADRHRYWLVMYAAGTRFRRFERLEEARRYLAHHDPQEGTPILVGCD
jgi:hypothetical protein